MARGTHWIQDIKFSADYLLCICGWEGKAYDETLYRKHRQTAPPHNEIRERDVSPSVYNRINKKRVKTLETNSNGSPSTAIPVLSVS